MKVVIKTDALLSNIQKASMLSNKPISLMFKDFYEDVYPGIKDKIDNKIFSLNIEGSVCYSLGKAQTVHSGAIVTSVADAWRYSRECGINEFYIPIDAYDEREGLCVYDASCLAQDIKSLFDAKLYGMITCGCMNERHPYTDNLAAIWEALKDDVLSISLGGSFWLGKDMKLPDFISDLRIGEYFLFGTIPFHRDNYKQGDNGIEIHSKVVAVYPERNKLLIDCGYAMADIDKSVITGGHNELQYVDSSSEYSIFYTQKASSYKKGDIVKFVPNYKSLVKLRYADKEFR